VVLVTSSALIACGGDDDGGGGTEVGAAVGAAQDDGSSTTAPSNRGTVGSTTTTAVSTTAGSREVPDLPPPDIPAEASTPTTAPGTEADTWPIGFPVDAPGNSVPLIGDIVVDLEPEGYVDFPIHLREGQLVAVISAGDDGRMTHIEIFRPDGTSEGSWQGGEPEVINGWEWVADDERVPLTGTYVFRVIHLGGSDEPFLLRFFGEE
jgi:hypothetical protein